MLSNINKQSSDIANLVDINRQLVGAGDQGIVYGYATNETKNYMPLPITLAHSLCQLTEKLIKTNKLPGAKFDMKSQVCINYDQNRPVSIDSMLMSIQHEKDANIERIRKIVINQVMLPLARQFKMNTDFKKMVNEAGDFVIGGPFGDTGLTGRKIIVDTYGGAARHGGGAFSGKDYTKVDRTGAYYARYIAKNIVAAQLADRCEVQLSFNIGSPKPSSIFIDTFGTSRVPEQKILEVINKVFNFDLNSIIKTLNMKNIPYKKLSVYGHVGRQDIQLP
ncbi:MAG: methionine adenosyltransferase [Mycoplasmoidaceae bacterium]|nr:methionine adenosyltransferase [Mycoplasmoidaceae bacterium]